jgi:DNA adenine methylase
MTSQSLGMNRTLHKIQGNKYKLLPEISNVLVSNNIGSDATWVEPFFGTGVMGFNLAPENAYFYDINPNIIMLYAHIKQRKITLKSLTKALHYHKKKFAEEGAAHYYRLRGEFNKNPNPLDFLILNRSGYNGLVRFSKRKQEFNTPYSKNDLKLTDTLIDELMRVFSLISYKIKHNNWHFKVSEFKSAINTHISDEKAVLICDPPYIGRNTQYFTDWTMNDEEELSAALTNHKGHFLLTTWFGEYELITQVNEKQKLEYKYAGKPQEDMPTESTNPAFLQFWNDFKRQTFVHKYCIAGASKRVGIYEAIVYK